LAPTDWEDDATLGELLQAAEAARRGRRLRSARSALAAAEAPLQQVTSLPPRGGGVGERGEDPTFDSPVQQTLLAALRPRAPRSYGAAYADLERLEVEKAALRRRE